MSINDTIKKNQFGPELTPSNLEFLTLLKCVVGNKFDTKDEFSLRTLMKLAHRAKYSTSAQQITIEDAVTCIVMKLLDYANANVLKNFELYLQQESCPSKCAETDCDYVKGSRSGGN